MSKSDTKLRILTIDENSVDRETYRRFLDRDAKQAYEILEAETAERGLEIALSGEIDCILLDYNLPDADGLLFLRELAVAEIDVPVILLTGEGSESIATEAIRECGQDYVEKGNLSASTLRWVVHNAVERAILCREIIRKDKALGETLRRELLLKDELLSNVSHELHTPLAAVHQFLSILLDEPADKLTDQQREFVNIAFRNAKQLTKLIGDLTDSSRAQAGKLRVELRPIALDDLVEKGVRVFERSAAARDVSLSCECADGLPLVLADDTRVEQIVNSLIENAIKFTPAMGSICVTVNRDTDHAGVLVVTVSDTGFGISGKGARKIFDRLHQGKSDSTESRKGMGLGLYLCRELVVSQGGDIWLESEPGRGSRFYFTLPVFSMPAIVREAVTEQGQLREVYSLVRVDLGPVDPESSSGLPESLNCRALHQLSSVIYPADVVLPRFLSLGHNGTYWIVAGTDSEGAKSLVRRIYGCLSSRNGIDSSKVRVRAGAYTEEISAADHQIPLDEALKNVAQRIEHVIQQSGVRRR